MTTAPEKYVPRNLVMNLLVFGLNILAGLWLVPYLVKHLGIVTYGFVPLAMFFNQYTGLIIQAISSSISRFLTIELKKGTPDSANIIFNSALGLLFILAIFQGTIGYIVIDNLTLLVNIPQEFYEEVFWLFVLTTSGFIISFFSSTFSISMYSQNRLDLMRINDVVRITSQPVLILITFSFLSPNLIYIGLASFLSSVLVLLISIYQWRRLTPNLKIDIRLISKERVRAMSGMSVWVLINSIGSLMFLRIDLYIVNKFVGVHAAGEYATILQWNQLFRSATGLLAGLVTPLGLIYYAKGELKKLSRIMLFSIKVLSVFLVLALSFVCGFAGDILNLWLGSGFDSLSTLLILQMSSLVINLGVHPLYSVATAMNKVKIPGLLTCAMGILNLGLAFYFIYGFNLGYYGVALAGAIVLTLKNTVFTPCYTAHLLGIHKKTFLFPLLRSLFLFVVLTCTATLLNLVVIPHNIVHLGLVAFAYSLILIPVVTKLVFTRDDYTLLFNVFPLQVKKYLRIYLMAPSL